MDPSPLLAHLRSLDPSGWGLGLSPANLRHTWADQVRALEAADLTAPVAGTPPRRVLIVASANVYVAPVPWMVHLAARGVPVRVKPARGQLDVLRRIAEGLPGVEVTPWVGGDVEAEAQAMEGVDGVIAFGGAPALDAIGRRVPPGVTWLPFGPRFGVAVVETIAPGVLLDHVLFDGRGCMSPAAVFARRPDLDGAAGLLARLAERIPPGPVDPATAVELRARLALARAVGRVVRVEGGAVIELPVERFSPVALPRVVTVYRWRHPDEVAAALSPWIDRLGTVATDGESPVPAPRVCAPGRMQRPPAGRFHDGVDVLGALWTRP